MNSFRFIHCSDLHIDSPFVGLSLKDPELGGCLRQSTQQAFENVVALALREKVDAVIVAGDVFDGAEKSLHAQFKFRDSLAKLSSAGIPAFIALGNHDPADTWSHSIQWPEGVHLFGPDVESISVKKNGKTLARIYGISFPTREVRENLAVRFPKNDYPEFGVSVLHCQVGNEPEHDNYAPCDLADLCGQGMDYWALGHIHRHKILRDRNPAIVYSGNTQAKNRRETGEKGCCLVTLKANQAPEIQFEATDSLRYFREQLDIASVNTIEEVVQECQNKVMDLLAVAENRSAVIELTLMGRTSVHAELQKGNNLHDLNSELEGRLKADSIKVWILLLDETAGPHDLESLKQGHDFTADVLSVYDELETPERLEELESPLRSMFQDWRGKEYVSSLSKEDLRDLVAKARDLTLDHLLEQDSP